MIDSAIEQVKTIYKEGVEYTKQRFGHPIFFSFLFAFAFFNWRPISIYIFSDEKIETTISRLYSYDNNGAVFWPILSAIVYTFTFPYLKQFIDWCLESAENTAAERDHVRELAVLRNKKISAADEAELADILSGKRTAEATQALIAEKDRLIRELTESVATQTERATENNTTQLNEISKLREQIAKLKEESGGSSISMERLREAFRNTNQPVHDGWNNETNEIYLNYMMTTAEKAWYLSLIPSKFSSLPNGFNKPVLDFLLKNEYLLKAPGNQNAYTVNGGRHVNFTFA